LAGKETDADKQMIDQHPITPPPKLVQQWVDAWLDAKVKHEELYGFIATQAARWGADQELEACCEWLKAKEWIHPEFSDELRAARRPKPPNLKEQTLALVEQHEDGWRPSPKDWDTIRRALETLDD